MQSLRSQFPCHRPSVHDRRAAISTQSRQARHRPRNDAEDRRLDASRTIPRQTIRQRGRSPGESCKQWHATPTSWRLRHLRSHRPAALSPKRRRRRQRRIGFRTGVGKSVESKSGQLLRRRRNCIWRDDTEQTVRSFWRQRYYARFSDSVRGFDQDQINFGTLFTPPRDYETNLELTYVAQIVPGWTVQPVYTSIWHPSGTGIRYPDAQVTGIRSVVRF